MRSLMLGFPRTFFSLVSTLALVGCLALSTGCHRYRIPDPKGPPQPKVKLGKADSNGSGMSEAVSSLKTDKKSYDKQGLLKQKKYERRKLTRKVGQRKIFGIVF
ncbi:hypothetical protein HER32_09425 [Hymenobacter sp. BT18]|uniref:hypothetical protein n=1 Tax=Hymenobacter sp. BT18 TaxID=2835648 RepID=UPI00143E3347|nr:hypothetical protein [Hymenobacter sp. BT18]QIX61385.1 hypothetical protein HER32_09425 [Hymenobacter sp. BT18]